MSEEGFFSLIVRSEFMHFLAFLMSFPPLGIHEIEGSSGLLLQGFLVAGERSKGRKLCRTGSPAHAWMLARLRVRQIDDIVIRSAHVGSLHYTDVLPESSDF